MTLTANKQLAHLYFETFLAGDLDRFDQILAEEFYVYHVRDRGRSAPASAKGPGPFKQAVPEL